MIEDPADKEAFGAPETADEVSAARAKDPVGYKNPPTASRFKKGVSGNPAGRPRGRRSFRTELREVLDAKVVVTESGRKSKVSTTHAMLLRLRQQALNGDSRAIDRLLVFAASHLPPDPPEDLDAVFREDEEIIKDYWANSSDPNGADDD